MLRGCRFAALIVCFAVTGCASMPGSTPASAVPQSMTCKGAAPCSADVTYEYWPEQCTFLSQCRVFAPDTIQVFDAGQEAAPSQITWKLPPGTHFHFATEGIKFERADSGFTCPAKDARAQPEGGDRHTFTCDNAGKKAEDVRGWKYWIRLEYGLAEHHLDPWVVNH